VLAMLGTNNGAREVIELTKDPQWRAEHIKLVPPEQRSLVEQIAFIYVPIGYLGLIGLGGGSVRRSKRILDSTSYA